MKKLATLVVALLLGATLSFAQTDTKSTADTSKKTDDASSKSKKGKKSKKSKKGASTDTTTAPPK